MYSNKIIQHFLKPENTGEISDPDAIGESGNPDNGNFMKIWVRVNKNIINEIKFKTVGCVPAIAAGSAVTKLVKGKTIEYALGLKERDVLRELGGLAPDKIHTIKLALNALKDALARIT
jgi:nitrogen fixation NifU-like protein